MKQGISVRTRSFFLLVMAMFIQAVAMAQQDSTVHTTQTTQTSTETSFHVEPWMWIVGGVVVVLIIILLLRGQSTNSSTSSDRVTVTKTVERDSNV